MLYLGKLVPVKATDLKKNSHSVTLAYSVSSYKSNASNFIFIKTIIKYFVN